MVSGGVRGGAQFVLFCSVGSFLSLFFGLLISCLLSPCWPVCAASCVLLCFVRSRPRGMGFVSTVHLVSSIRSGLLWRYSHAVHLIWIKVWEEFQFPSFPHEVDGLPHFPRLAGCPLRMHRGQPALGRHQPVSILVETSAGCCCRGSRDSSASESVCLRRGGHPAERAESGVWVGTPGSWPSRLVLTSMGAPLQQSAASALPEGSHSAQNPISDFLLPL